MSAKEALVLVESVGNKSIDDNFDNTKSLWNFMECYLAVFEPLQKTIINFQAEQLHYGDFYAQWLKCQMYTEKVIQNNVNKELIQKIGKNLLESIEKRTNKLLENESLIACLFLDPRSHFTLSPQKREEAVSYLKHIWSKLRSVCPGSQPVPTQSTVNANDLEYDGDEMLNKFLTQKLQSTSGEVAYTYVHAKIANLHLPFSRSETNVLHFWKERKHSEPELYELSNVCFGIPPSQVTIERAFSALKTILTDNRNRLSHAALEDILLVKLNQNYLDEAVNNLALFEEETIEY